MFCYSLKYRPPQFSWLPEGWELLETPHDRGGINRPDLPTSTFRFGVIGLTQQLTTDEREQYELTYVGER